MSNLLDTLVKLTYKLFQLILNIVVILVALAAVLSIVYVDYKILVIIFHEIIEPILNQ